MGTHTSAEVVFRYVVVISFQLLMDELAIESIQTAGVSTVVNQSQSKRLPTSRYVRAESPHADHIAGDCVAMSPYVPLGCLSDNGVPTYA